MVEGEEKIYSMFIASCLNKKVHSFVPKEEEDADEEEEEEEPAPPDAYLRKSSRCPPQIEQGPLQTPPEARFCWGPLKWKKGSAFWCWV